MSLGFPPVPRGPGAATLEALKRHCEQLAEKINALLIGKTNNVLTVTLTANVATTTVTDARLGVNSALNFMPTTANAAAEIGNGTLYVGTRSNGSCVITHANNAQTDRTYKVTVSG